MQKILLILLSSLARRIIMRHKPVIIGVTGTVGKTTITTHITKLLLDHFPREAIGFSALHYNGEYGLPLTIIWAKTGGKNIFKWLYVFGTALWRMIRPYPRYLLLEYGIDHPGEMDFLLSIAVPDYAIISRIAPNHLEQFGTIEAYRDEKLKISRHPTTHIIAHESLRPYLSDGVIYYGSHADDDIHIQHLHQKLDGLDIEVAYEGHIYTFTAPVFGDYQSENIVPLFAIAKALDIPYTAIEKLARSFLPEAGRSALLSGTGDSIIIDGSYNGGYESISRGIDALVPFLDTQRIIVLLWDMRELWGHAEALHEALARSIIEKIPPESREQVSIYLVGPLSLGYMAPILHEYFTVETSLSSRDIGRRIHAHILSEIRPTLIYVKWSQNTIFLEEAVREILAHHEDSQLLCRQSPSWMTKKEAFFQTIPKNTL
jgi:UDP-N-acetylmuramoyl-tripeptide--D-alanyl-D-alanine ligase